MRPPLNHRPVTPSQRSAMRKLATTRPNPLKDIAWDKVTDAYAKAIGWTEPTPLPWWKRLLGYKRSPNDVRTPETERLFAAWLPLREQRMASRKRRQYRRPK